MKSRTLVVGEALVDVVSTPNGVRELPGGSPFNVAIGLARLGHPVELATCIGDDAHGRVLEEQLAHEFVQLTEGSRCAQRTSTARATLDENGAASYEFDVDWRLQQVPTGFEHLHTGSYAAVLQPGADQVLDTVRAARADGTVSYDPNIRPDLMGRAEDVRSDVEQLIGSSDVVKASDEDVSWLYGDGRDLDPVELTHVLQQWGRLGPLLTIVTLGAQGALVHLPLRDETVHVPGRTTSVADTVGAGDSFMSGLLSGLLDQGLLGGPEARSRLSSMSWAEAQHAVDRAVETSAVTVSRVGAQPPRRDEIT